MLAIAKVSRFIMAPSLVCRFRSSQYLAAHSDAAARGGSLASVPRVKGVPSPPSRPFDEAVDDALLARFVELDGELVAVDEGDVAVAEFLVEDALADRERRGRAGRFR